MKKRILLPVLVLGLTISCAKKDGATGATARVMLKDGTSFTGTVTSTTPTQMSLAVEGGSRTVDLKQVKAVEYLDAPDAAPAAGAPGQAGAPPARASAGSAPATPPRHHPVESAIQTKSYLLPVGTEITVRTDETIDSGKGAEGQVYAGEVARDVLDAQRDVVIPRGSNVKLVIKSASKGGRFRGAADLVLDLRSVSVDGREYLLDTEDMVKLGRQGVGKNKRTAEFVGAGAAIGAVIGAIAGGGKGAAIGAASGAGAGVATEVLTKGGSVKVPAESLLTFRLDAALKVYPSN